MGACPDERKGPQRLLTEALFEGVTPELGSLASTKSSFVSVSQHPKSSAIPT